MRKTLTVLIVALAATSLAACKMFWEKDQPPPSTPAVAEMTTATPTETAATTAPTGEAANTATPATETAKTTAPAQPATPPAKAGAK